MAVERLSYNHSNEIQNLVVFTVFKTGYNQGGTHDNWSFLDFDRSEYFNFYVRGDNGKLGFSNANSNSNIRDNYSNTGGLNDNQPHLGTAVYNACEILDTKIRIDGREDYAHNRENTGVNLGTGKDARYGFIGDGSEASSFDGSRNNQHYQGEIAEIIYFENEELTPEEIYKIETYLGLKYNLTLNHDYLNSDGTVIWDYDMNTDFNQDIIGIGRDDLNDWHFRQNKLAQEMISIGHRSIDSSNALNPNNFDSNQSSLVLGSNGIPADSIVRGNLPEGTEYHSARVWLAQKSGNIGTVRLRIDASSLLNSAVTKNNELPYISL